MSDCYNASNNRNFGCPPRMADGRHFTDYRPNCELVQHIRADNKISNSFQFRQFMQSNGEALANVDRKIACDKNCCAPCSAESFNSVGTMLPEAYLVSCDNRSCKRSLVNASGLGDGREYNTVPQQCQDIPTIGRKPNNCISPIDQFSYNGQQ